MKKEDIKLVGIVDEDPFDPLTWSGISYYFFSAFKELGVLVKAVSAELRKSQEFYYKAVNFHPNLSSWRFRYRIDTDRYDAMTRKVRGELNSIDSSGYSVILQVGAWYDATEYRDKITVSYHDGNIAALTSSPYHTVPFVKRHMRNAFRHEMKLYSRMNLIFTMSKWLADSFINDFHVNPKKIYPVGAGVNMPFSDDAEKKDYSRPSLLFVGKDFKRKGGLTLLRAFRRVRQEMPGAILTIIGPSLRLQEDGVRILGPISKRTQDGMDRIIRAFQDASVFVLPSLFEPFGVSFCEAMAHRLPCVGTNICAIPEIIEHEKSGLLVPLGDELALSQALIMLLKSPSMCSEMGKVGHERYKQDFTWDAVTKRIVDIISTQY